MHDSNLHVPPLWLAQANGNADRPKDSKPYQRARHARYFESDRLYHVISRTIQGLFLLNPDRHGELESLIAGVLGRACKTFSRVRLHAAAFLSNHFHLAISGDHQQLAAFVGYVKREISRRWGPRIGWRGIFEAGYESTAVITAEGQVRCLKYILSQGVKEGLVVRPEDWPGLHCAESLVTGEPIPGRWFNATEFGRAERREARKRQPTPVDRAAYFEPSNASFEPLPALSHLDSAAHRALMATLVAEVVADAREQRGGRPVLGLEGLLAADRMTRRAMPPPPWFEERRRMVVWDSLRAPEVRAYLERYWQFQVEFRAAAARWRQGERDVVFPSGAFWPGRSRPIAHALAAAA